MDNWNSEVRNLRSLSHSLTHTYQMVAIFQDNLQYDSGKKSFWLRFEVYVCETKIAKHCHWTKSQSINRNVLKSPATNSCNKKKKNTWITLSNILKLRNHHCKRTHTHLKYGINNYGYIQSKCLHLMCACVDFYSAPLPLLAFEYCSQQSICVDIFFLVHLLNRSFIFFLDEFEWKKREKPRTRAK